MSTSGNPCELAVELALDVQQSFCDTLPAYLPHSRTAAIQQLGADNVMFETDFPHPTCLYPDSSERGRAAVSNLPEEVQRKVLHDNAASLYKIVD